MSGNKAYALTTPLITKSDGSKFGKLNQEYLVRSELHRIIFFGTG